MKQTLTIVIIGLLVLLCSCETMKGLGKDVQKAGQWVEDTAE